MTVTVENGNNDNDYHADQNINNQQNGNSKTTIISKCWKFILQRFQHLTVEPIVALVFLCNSLTDAIGTELILSRTCLNTFGFSKEECSSNMTESIRNVVQPYASNIILARSLIDALFPAVLSLFIGPWMDINGRKPFLISPIIGMMISHAISLGLTYVQSLSPVYFIIPSFPTSLAGGMVAVQACSYSYLADTTTAELRAVRMSILALFMGLGTMLGYQLSNTYNKKFNSNLPLSIYGTAIGIMLIDALYSIFVLRETVKTDEGCNQSLWKKIISLFNLEHIKESIKVLFAKKPGHGRVLILLLIPAIVLTIFIEQGEAPYLLLATKAAFSWTSENYNSFRSTMVLIAVCVGAPGLFILKRYVKVTDLTFLFIVTIMQLVSSFIIAFTKTTTTLYVGKAFGTFIDLVKAVGKTKISFLVLSIDIGKLFAVVSTLEAITPLIATPTYSAVYNVVLTHKRPMQLFLLSGTVAVLILLLLIVVKAIQWKYGIKEVRRR